MTGLEADQSARRTVQWVGGLFLMGVLLQRFAVPNGPVALLLPAAMIWGLFGLARGVLVIDRNRAMLWLAAFGATALVIPVQARLVPGALISLTSWGLFMVVWSPFALRLADQRPQTYLLALRSVTRTCFWLATACIVMLLSQLAGLRYVDWFARAVPDALELPGFVITYPVAYGSELYRANAWIGLEPSMISMQLGLGLLAAIFASASARTLAVIMLGLVATISGSGFAIVGVGIVVMALHPMRSALRRYVPIAVGVGLAASSSSFGAVLLERVTEFQSGGSSTSLRGIEPYRVLWPTWVGDIRTILFGRGPGAAQQLVEDTNVLGLIVPSPIKVFFEYGVLAGLVLAAFLFACYAAGPSRSFAVSLLVSLWLLQPGTTTFLVVLPVMVFVTLWSPRPGPVLENQPALLARARRRREWTTPFAGQPVAPGLSAARGQR